MGDARNCVMDAETRDESVWQALVMAYKARSGWQKGVIIFALVATFPFGLLVAAVTGLSLFPLFLFGRWEGDGDQSVTHEAERKIEQGRAYTANVYGH